ncbi:1-acyl-sn-glycerol-3-phosphate acyltransferase [Gottschalkia purinilytica]|uniref:1-acyl-sn-glycerol-3-phosphate acyltransferase n=1 Tax=Gottschalkia purinilytica TaxID=1503 RepID=A0A0L0WAJ6_GOTPU|nr:lysophospholipid acyltransferase family protein [Gottschalkia purinilytica]KNF08345.1 1-acyl-sn-glycerol-3-phosphate acyltransferase [Gottschalkia purinilytica]
MLRTIVWFIYFWVSLVLLLPSLLRVKILDKSGNIAKRDEVVNRKVKKWAKSVLVLSGCEVNVIGEENVPEDGSVLFVSNHQGNFDIPILLTYIQKPKAFLAKSELKKLPMINKWMKYLNCIFLDRKNPRESIKAINNGVEILKEGYSLVVFPEGTRSKDGKLGEFKSGSLKLATKSGVPIVPVTIKGSNKIMEKGSLIIRPAKVEIIISPPIEVNDNQSKDTKELTEVARKAICENL